MSVSLPAFNVLLTYDDDAQAWCAHCLEMDLVEEGDTKAEAIGGLIQNMKIQIEESVKLGLHYLNPAPVEYYSKLDKQVSLYVE